MSKFLFQGHNEELRAIYPMSNCVHNPSYQFHSIVATTTPASIMSKTLAEPRLRSNNRPVQIAGPLSLTLHVTTFPRYSTCTFVPNGKVLWAHVNARLLKRSPEAVSKPSE